MDGSIMTLLGPKKWGEKGRKSGKDGRRRKCSLERVAGVWVWGSGKRNFSLRQRKSQLTTVSLASYRGRNRIANSPTRWNSASTDILCLRPVGPRNGRQDTSGTSLERLQYLFSTDDDGVQKCHLMKEGGKGERGGGADHVRFPFSLPLYSPRSFSLHSVNICLSIFFLSLWTCGDVGGRGTSLISLLWPPFRAKCSNFSSSSTLANGRWLSRRRSSLSSFGDR